MGNLKIYSRQRIPFKRDCSSISHPPKIAHFASRVIEAENNAVIVDLTAGTGNLLKPYAEQNDSALCLGIELDKSNIPTHTENHESCQRRSFKSVSLFESR